MNLLARIKRLEHHIGNRLSTMAVDDEQSAILQSFVESGNNIDAAWLDGGSVMGMIHSQSPACRQFRIDFGNWIGERRILFPGAILVRCRRASFNGTIAVSRDGKVVQVWVG